MAGFVDHLESAISAECEKLIRRHQKYAHEVAKELVRIERRSGVKHVKVLYLPSYWKTDNGFNPYHVRPRARAYAYAINVALKDGTYLPRPAVSYSVPKKDGGVRIVSVFQVADNALVLSRIVFKDLTAKKSSVELQVLCI